MRKVGIRVALWLWLWQGTRTSSKLRPYITFPQQLNKSKLISFSQQDSPSVQCTGCLALCDLVQDHLTFICIQHKLIFFKIYDYDRPTSETWILHSRFAFTTDSQLTLHKQTLPYELQLHGQTLALAEVISVWTQRRKVIYTNKREEEAESVKTS